MSIWDEVNAVVDSEEAANGALAPAARSGRMAYGGEMKPMLESVDAAALAIAKMFTTEATDDQLAGSAYVSVFGTICGANAEFAQQQTGSPAPAYFALILAAADDPDWAKRFVTTLKDSPNQTAVAAVQAIANKTREAFPF